MSLEWSIAVAVLTLLGNAFFVGAEFYSSVGLAVVVLSCEQPAARGRLKLRLPVWSRYR